MSVWGIITVKDEIDVLERVLAHMAGQVDNIVVADNGSTDGTYEWLHDEWAYQSDHRWMPGPGFFAAIPDHCAYDGSQPPRTVFRDREVGYYQSQKMSALAAFAAASTAEWVVPFDADEIWVARDPGWGTIAQVLASLPPAEGVATAELYDHVATADDVDARWPIDRMVWRRPEPAPLPKVAVRPLAPVVIEQGNHGAHYPAVTPSPVLVVHHFPYRSPEQMISKARNGGAAYAATDLPEDFGKHWRDYNRLSDEQLTEAFYTWFHETDPAAAGLIEDPVPVLPDSARVIRR